MTHTVALTRWLYFILLTVASVNVSGQTEATDLFDIAREKYEAEDRDSAVYYAELALLQTSGSDSLAGKIEHFIGYVFIKRYRCKEALPRFMRAITILEPMGLFPTLVADSYLKAGGCEPKPETKMALLGVAMERFTALSDSVNLAGGSLDLALLSYRQGQIESTRQRSVEGLSWLGNADRPDLRSRLNFVLGRYYNGTGNSEAALLYFENTYDELIASNPKDPFIFNLCKDYGTLLASSGDYLKAIEILSTPLLPDTVKKSAHRLSAEADIWNDLGKIHTDAESYADAEQAFQKASECLQPYYGDKHVFTAYPYAELINLYVKTGQLEEANLARNEALRILEGQPVYKHPDYAEMSKRMAIGLLGLNEPGKALERINAGLNSLGFIDTAGIDLGDVYRYDLLADLINRKTELLHKYELPGENPLEQYEIHIAVLDSLQTIQLDPSTRMRILEENYHVYEKAIAALYDANRMSPSDSLRTAILEVSEHSKDQLYTRFLLQNTLRNELGVPEKLHQEEREINSKLAAIELDLYNTKNADSTQRNTLLSEQRTLRLALLDVQNKINYPLDFNAAPTSDLANIVNSSSDHGIIHVFHGSTADYLICVSQGKTSVIRHTEQSWLNTLVTALHTASPEWLVAGHELYQVLAPFITRLPQNVSNLLVIPDGTWAQIPIEALPTGPIRDDGSSPLLIERFNVSYGSSLRHIGSGETRSRPPEKLAAYAPTYDALVEIPNDTADSELYAELVRSGAYALPGADRESKIVVGEIGGKRFTGNDASERHFREHAKDYQVLHLSMHALLEDDNPNFSRLLFTRTNDPVYDDYLFASELSQLQLNADLAVLSACNTGRGKSVQGEGVMSLSRSFHYAGVPSVIHSLWKVPDNATADLMPRFYDNLKRGENKAAALRNAKLDYLLNTIAPEERHPYYWAGFVATGDTSPIQFSSNSPWHYILLSLLVVGLLTIMGVRRKQRRNQAV